jgi:hypothetical protein
MDFHKYILSLIAVAALFTTSNADDPKPKPEPKSNANYRQSNSRRTNTITNPYAITSKKKLKEDPAAAAAFKKLNAQYWKLIGSKKFDAIHSAIDQFLAGKKLTPDQKSVALWYKANAYFAAKEYEDAVSTARQGMRAGGEGAGRNASVIIRAAMAEKNYKLAEQTIAEFEKSSNYADAYYYGAVVDLCFYQKRLDAAFNYLKAYGKQPNLSVGNRAQIFNGFGRYFMMKKRYKDAIAQYSAIKDIPKVDIYSSGNADLQIAACYLKMNNKAKALEIYKSLSKSKHSGIRSNAQKEIKKLTAKPAPKKKPASRKKK